MNYKIHMKKFYEKIWFKNSITISLPAIISILGIVYGNVENEKIQNLLFLLIIVLFLVIVIVVVVLGKQDEKLENKVLELENKVLELEGVDAKNKIVIEGLMLENGALRYTASVTSYCAESWAKSINAFANAAKNGKVFEKSWDKVGLHEEVCRKCTAMIEKYVGIEAGNKVSVGFISYYIDSGVPKIRMTSHSDPDAIRPLAYNKEEVLSKSKYHYAELISDLIDRKQSDIEVAVNNEEILRIFKNINAGDDLSKYTQYIAIPIYCSKNKILGILQIVTKYDYVIKEDKIKLKEFAQSFVLPYSNFLVLIDKIQKGLYVTPENAE